MIFDKETILNKLEEKSNQKYEEMKSSLAKTMLDNQMPAAPAPSANTENE